MGNQSSTNVEEDIIIKCGLKHMTKHFFNEYVFVWHDPNITSGENQGYIPQIEKLCEVKTFTEWEEASKFIKDAKAICHVITSGKNGELLCKEISSSKNVSSVYIFCANKKYHSTWAKSYPQIACVEDDIKPVLKKIEQNLLKWYQDTSSLKLNLPAFAPVFNDGDKSDMNNLHLYLKALTNFKNRAQAKNDFITLSRATYPHKEQRQFIDKFEKKYKTYNKADILNWYTKECFLYKLINNCLRVASTDSIQYCRLLLKDLEQAIKEQYQAKSNKWNGVLYRGAYLSGEEWKVLKENLGKEIEIHGFLSASKKTTTPLALMEDDSDKKVFISIIVPKGLHEEEQGFAEIAEFSEFPGEQEVLFNVRSRFTVLETEDKHSLDLPYRHLVLLYGAQGFRKFLAEAENVEKEVSIPSSENISCEICKKTGIHQGTGSGKMFFLSLADLQNRTYICQKCLSKYRKDNNTPLLCIPILEELTNYTTKIKGCVMTFPKKKDLYLSLYLYGYSCEKCKIKKCNLYLKCTQCNEGKEKWCADCRDNVSGCMKAGHAVVLESSPFSFWCEKMSEAESYHLRYQNGILTEDKLFTQAEVYSQSSQHQKVIEFYTAFLQRYEKTSDYLERATAYNNLGRAYESKADYPEALAHYFKCLELSKSALGKDHPDLTTPYNNIGNVYKRQGDFSKAQEYYSKALNLSKNVDYENESDLATSYNNLGNVHYSQGEFPQALENYFEALKIFELLKGESHPLVATIYNNIASTYQSQGEDQKALEYHKKSLEKRRVVHGEKHPDVAASYNNMGRVYEKQGKLKEALENYSKSLEIYKEIRGENHPDLTTIWNNIGNIHYLQGDYVQALDNYSNALKVSKSASDRATSYHNLANVFYSKGEYKNALEHSSKALKIFQETHGSRV